MATENILMDAVQAGGDRQDLHEAIRQHSMEAGKQVKVEGKENDLLKRIAADPRFNLSLQQLESIMEPKNFIGRASEQTVEFFTEWVDPILQSNHIQDDFDSNIVI